MLRPHLSATLLALALSLSAAALEPAQAAGGMVAIFPEDEAPRAAPKIVPEIAPDITSVAPAKLRGEIPAPSRRSLEAYRSDAMRLYRHPPRSLRHETDLACVAVAIFHEARGETTYGQMAVASVILQRALTPDRWGDTPCAVVRPVQFSFMTSRYGFPAIAGLEPGWERAWGKAIDIAAMALVSGPLPALKDADHYHTIDVYPEWRLHMKRTARIGKHYFYHDPDSAPVIAFH